MQLPEHCIDYRDRRIEFPNSAVRHILDGHPEMDPYLVRICEALADPDFVFSRPNENTHFYYKQGICSDENTGAYFVVFVRYNGTRAVRTAHSSSRFPYNSYLIYQRQTEI